MQIYLSSDLSLCTCVSVCDCVKLHIHIVHWTNNFGEKPHINQHRKCHIITAFGKKKHRLNRMEAAIFSWGLSCISPMECLQQPCEKARRYIICCWVLLFAKTGAIFADSKAADIFSYINKYSTFMKKKPKPRHGFGVKENLEILPELLPPLL